MKELKVGFIGFGFIGKVHAHGYVNLPFDYRGLPFKPRITHICTSRASTAAEGCALLGAEHAVTDFRQVTENPDIDIVHICTPNHLHKDAVLSAMRHQKHIYCDKPITATVAEAGEIAAALPAYKGTAQMTLQNRFSPAIVRATQLIADGFLGRVLEFRAGFFHSGSVDPAAPVKWKLTSEAGGGVIADLGSHILDLVHFLLGDYASLSAASHIAYADRPSADDPSRRIAVDAEDAMQVLARMKNGATGTLEATKLATGTEDEIRFEIHGTSGALRFNSMSPHHLDVYDSKASDKPLGGRRGWCRIDVGQRLPAPASGFPGPKYTIGWSRIHAACLANFLFDIAAGNPGNPGLRQGIYVQRLMQAVREASSQRRWIDTEFAP